MIKSIIAPLIISIYGDSTILGLEVDVAGKAHITQNTAPAMLQKWYGERAVVNSQAKVGLTLNDLLRGTGWFTEPFSEAIKKDPGKVVIMNFAINDSMAYDQTTYKKNLNEFITIVRANNKIPVLEEPNPVCITKEWIERLAVFVRVMDTVSAETNTLLIPQYKYIATNVPNWPSMLGDCIHPNDDTLYSLKAHLEYLTLEANL